MADISKKRPPIAVIGVSALFPGSINATGFWKDILAASDLITDVPSSHWLVEDYYDADPKAPDKTYAKRGGFLKKVDFDAMGWGVPPSIVPATDTSQLLALIVAEQVLKDAAGSQFESMDRSRISVILGVTSAQELLATMVSRLQRPIWVKSLREHGLAEEDVQDISQRIGDHYQPWQESSFPGLLGNVVAGRIANRLDLGGTNCVTDAACASTFSSISMAAQELYLGDSDMVIAGGVDTLNDIFMYMCFSKTPALSLSGDCRPFSDQADGTMLGEGLGMVALKRLDDAERDGDTIYGVLSGIGSSSDGRSKSVYAPVSKGQSMALARAYEHAGFGPETVEIIEAHGTGTKAGDAAEFNGLKLIFEPKEDGPKQWCALGSVKSQIGHTKAAAGAGGLFKAVMALHHKALPPTIKVAKPNPNLDIENSAFYLNTETRPWIRPSDHPRRAAVSSFGFGGSNFHLALEEYTGDNKANRLRSMPFELVTIGGKDGAEVARLSAECAARATKEGMLTRLAWESQKTYSGKDNARLAVVASDEADLVKKLTRAAAMIAKNPEKAFEHPDGTQYGFGDIAGDVAFIFPGQGSQYVGMGAALAIGYGDAIRPWDLAADMKFDDKLRLDQVVFPIPKFSDEDRENDETLLRATQWAQPAIGTASLAVLQLMKAMGVEPKAVAGHSFGEVTALHAAGVLTEEDMLKVARKRGELMAAAAEKPGAMTAVTTTIDIVREVLKSLGTSDVVVANHNAPEQVVISGTVDAVRAAEAAFDGKGIGFKPLRVSTAFHSPVVSASAKPFTSFLNDINFADAKLPVYSGESAKAYESGAKEKRARLGRQISNPVRFVELIENLYADGVRTFVEVGPNAVLTKLAGQILEGKPHTAATFDRRSKHGIEALWRGLAALVAAGVELNLLALWDEYGEPVDLNSLPKPKLVMEINGANYGKAYPPEGGAAALPTPNPPKPKVVEKPIAAAPAPKPVAAAPAPAPKAPVAQPAPVQPQAPQVMAQQTMVQNSAASPQWIATWQEAQRQNAMSLMAFQHAMAQSQSAYIQAVQTSFQTLAGQAPTQAPQGVAPAAPTIPQYAPAPAPAPAAPAPTPAASTWSLPKTISEPMSVAAPAPVQPVAQASAGVDLHALMLAAVAEKTGYPTEMLDLSMDLEGDLGVDSIKRVEILGAVQDQVPGLPQIDTARMSALKTLGEIVDYMQGLLGTPAPIQPSAPAIAAPAIAAPAAPAAPAVDLHALMLAAVSDKTGYPAEMLELEMDLEGDLGIDSIKRVEILSAVQEQAPGMPEVDTGTMSALKTLGEIVEYMQGLMGSVAPAASAPAAAAPAAPAVDLHALMLAAVSDKTGYPGEMLELEMDLEGDLGIDSIKRVEILSAVQEKAPGMPDVDTAAMGSLKTLGEIVEYMQGLMGSVAPAAVSAAPVAAPAAAGPDLHALMLEAVSDKTGYPADMLELEMDLEGDLGIDSIKRVEILSAVQENAPGMPDVDTAAMGSLKTLGEIVDYMQGLMGTPAPTSAPVAAAPAAAGPDLHALMLEAVSDKTGYPSDMLELEMDLEGDLGIDSIKRVEILSAVQENAPGMPDVDTAAMGSLKTLGEIVEYMQGLMGGAAPAAPAPLNVAPAVIEAAGIGRFRLDMVPTPAVGLAMRGLGGEILVTNHGDDLADSLVAELTSRGLNARSVTEVPADANAVIYLGGLRDIKSADEGIAIECEAFDFARTLAPKFTQSGGVFVTVQDTGGAFATTDFDAERAYLAGLPGLVKTAAIEWPLAELKAIDIERAGRDVKQIATLITNELLGGGGDIEVGLAADGTRVCPISVEDEVVSGAALIGAGDVVIVSGGARGVTAACVIEWAKQSKANFVLLGRTPLADEPASCKGAATDADLKRVIMTEAIAAGQKPKPADIGRQVKRILAGQEIRNTLAAVKTAGGDALYLAADVTDAAGISAGLVDVRKNWGPIKAIVHGAGVLADKKIADMSNDDFDFVFNTKIEGFRALLEVTKADPIAAICLFSSVSARCGNNGQANYAMANEVLNKIAWAERAERGENVLVKSIGWGPWDGGMVTPQLRSHFAALGVPMIPLQQGAEMFAAEMKNGSPHQVELVMGGEPKAAALMGDGAGAELALEVNISRDTHAFLEGHQITGTVVVPVVMALEWFSRVARAYRRDLHLASLKDLKVLKGMKLTDFNGAGDRFIISAKPIQNGSDLTLALELQGADGSIHYRAKASMLKAHSSESRVSAAPAGLKTWGDAALYGDVLFHTNDFQVITGVEGVGAEGITGGLKGVQEAAWNWDAWQTDVAALDGGLQMLLLWARKELGGAALPMAIGEFWLGSELPVAGPVKVVAECKSSGKQSATANVIFEDKSGTMIAEMKKVELVLRPDVAKS